MSHRRNHIEKIGRVYLRRIKPVRRNGKRDEPGSSSSRRNRDQREEISLPYRQSHSHSTSDTQGRSRNYPTPPPVVPTPPPAASYEEAAEETRARRVRFASPPPDQQHEYHSSSSKEEQSQSPNENVYRSSSSRQEQGTSSRDKEHHTPPRKQKQDRSKGYEHRSSSTKQERGTSSKRPDNRTSSNKHEHHSLPKKKEHHISSKLGQSASTKREQSKSYKKPENRTSADRDNSSSKVATSSREPKGGGSERVSPKDAPNPTAWDITLPIQQARARGKDIIKSLQFTINVVLLHEWCMNGDDFRTLPKRFKSKFKVIPVKRDSVGKYQPIEDTKSKWGVKTKYDPKYSTYLATILIRIPPELAKLPRGQLNAAYRRFFVEPRNEKLKDLREIPFKDNPDLRKCAMLFHFKSGSDKPRLFDDYLLEDAVIKVRPK
ncbi:hypothetical protein GGR58DRAFT_526626 [Xylaria digitata]|nr:hypothetical protein GGR58DRAFT_526626 [Xylaria digitata]